MVNIQISWVSLCEDAHNNVIVTYSKIMTFSSQKHHFKEILMPREKLNIISLNLCKTHWKNDKMLGKAFVPTLLYKHKNKGAIMLDPLFVS